MPSLNVFHYMDDLRNVNEKRVWNILSEYIDSVSEEEGLCLCSICLTDIAAITLNSIAPHYQQEEHLSVARERLPDAEIFRQMKKAIEKVKNKPHH